MSCHDMSLGSHKSLNDELSEVWEHSFTFSARSVSEESLSGEDDGGLARELLLALSPASLSRLKRSFSLQHNRGQADGNRKVEQAMRAAAAEEGIHFPQQEREEALNLLCVDEGTFAAAIDEIFEHHKYSPHARQLFQLLTPLGQQFACWGDLLAKLASIGARRTRGRGEKWAGVAPGVMRQMKHCKRETIVKLVHVGSTEWFCYACISRGGRVGLYCANMRLLHHYELWYHRTGQSRRVRNAWVTDAIYMSDVQCLLISASDRSITIYDASILSHTPLYCITGTPHIPTCLAYAPSSATRADSELLIGDERGVVTSLRFLQPRAALFHKTFADKINTYFWMALSSPPHDAYCSWRRWREHERSVRRVWTGHSLLTRASCSKGRRAVVVRPRGKAPARVLAVDRGVSCMQIVPSLRLLVTGGPDGAVRLWDVSQSTPFATLWGSSRATVLDIAVLPRDELVVAFCGNCSLDIWDLYEECLLQSVRVRFPFLGVLGRKAEFGTYCIHAGAPRRPVEDPSSPRELDEIAEGARSRRSSVYRGPSGGLRALPEPDPEDDEDSDVTEYSARELILTCCDYTYTLRLSGAEAEVEGEAPPPPGDTRRARRPSVWDISADMDVLGPIAADSPSKKPPPSPSPTPRLDLRPSPSVTPHFDLQPSTTLSSRLPGQTLLVPDHCRSLGSDKLGASTILDSAREATTPDSSMDLEKLLESAGLQGILERDVTLMMPLKHDLNAKIAELARNMDQIAGPVAAGAPYLALRLYEPEPLGPVDEMTSRYKRILGMFPASSSICSTPRSQRSSSSRTLSRKTKSTRSS